MVVLFPNIWELISSFTVRRAEDMNSKDVSITDIYSLRLTFKSAFSYDVIVR